MPLNNHQIIKGSKDTCKDIRNSSSAIRKSILRNPEIPFKDETWKNINFKSQNVCKNHTKISGDTIYIRQDEVPQKTLFDRDACRDYHEPRLNKISEMRKTLDDLRQFQMVQVDKAQGISKSTQISSKLNFSKHETVFKNLVKLDDDAMKESHKSSQKNFGKVGGAEHNDKISDEVEIINTLINLDYEKEEHMRQTLYPLPFEEKFFGFDVISKPDYGRLKHLEYSNMYFNSVYDEINQERYKEDFTEPWKLNPLWKRPESIVNACKCLNQFNN